MPSSKPRGAPPTSPRAPHPSRMRDDTRAPRPGCGTSGPGAGAGGTSSLPTTGAHPGHETPVDADGRPLHQGPLDQGPLDQGTVDPRQDPDLGGTHRA